MKSFIENLSNIIAAISEYKYFVLITLFVTFTDLFLVNYSSIGLLGYRTEVLTLPLDIVTVIIYLLIFSVYMAAVVPLTIATLKLIWLSMPHQIIYFFNRTQERNEEYKAKSKDYIRYSELIKIALKEKDSIKLNYVKELKAEQVRSKSHEKQVSFYCFAVFLLLFISFFTINENQGSLINWAFFNLFSYSDDTNFLNLLIVIISWIFLYVMIHIGLSNQIFQDTHLVDYIYFTYEDNLEEKIERRSIKFD